jgi:hypothetical protein
MIIDNSKFIITNELTEDKYGIRIVRDVNLNAGILKIENSLGVVYFAHYLPLTFFITDTSLVIIGENIYAEFSVDNCNDFSSPSDKINQLLNQVQD